MEAHTLEDQFDLRIPMLRAMPETVKGTFQEPVFIFCCFRITNGRLNNSDFIRGEEALAEGVLAVPLFEDLSLLDCHAEKEAHCVGMEDRGVLVGLGPYPVFMIAKDNNAGFGTVGGHHLVWFDGEEAHGRYCPRGALLLKTAIFGQS
jgi:hypothetical protein